jgi:hypothetical protein
LSPTGQLLEPSAADKMIPVWGSFKSFLYDLYMGNYGEAIVDGAMTALDIVGVVTGVEGLAKFGAGLLAEMSGELAAKEAAAAAARSADAAVVASNLEAMTAENPWAAFSLSDPVGLGENVGVVAEGNPTIDSLSDLPNRGRGQYLGPNRPTIDQVYSLAERTGWEREVAITYKPGTGGSGGGGDYYLFSAPYDAAGNAATAFPEDHYIVYHTHVNDAFASQFDMDWMADNPNGQSSSVIIHRIEDPFTFTATESNLPLQNGRR